MLTASATATARTGVVASIIYCVLTSIPKDQSHVLYYYSLAPVGSPDECTEKAARPLSRPPWTLPHACRNPPDHSGQTAPARPAPGATPAPPRLFCYTLKNTAWIFFSFKKSTKSFGWRSSSDLVVVDDWSSLHAGPETERNLAEEIDHDAEILAEVMMRPPCCWWLSRGNRHGKYAPPWKPSKIPDTNFWWSYGKVALCLKYFLSWHWP